MRDNHLCPRALPQSPNPPILAPAELLGFSLGAGVEQRLLKHSSKHASQPGVATLSPFPALMLWLQKVTVAWLSP